MWKSLATCAFKFLVKIRNQKQLLYGKHGNPVSIREHASFSKRKENPDIY